MGVVPENLLELYRQESLRRLERGGIPFAAQQRLDALRGREAELFTGELTVGAFAVARDAGLRPLSQVMGSGVFNVSAGPGTAKKWNDGRIAALHRMWLEGRACGAHIVTGVSLRHAVPPGEPREWVEFTATGSAMTWAHRLGGKPRTGEPVLTNLSAQDCWKLARHGCQPLALVTSTNVNWVWFSRPGPVIGAAPGDPGGAWGFGELGDVSRKLRAVYADAVTDMQLEAARLGADGLIGVSFEREMEADPSDGSRRVMVHAVATAISRRGGHAGAGLGIMPVRGTSG